MLKLSLFIGILLLLLSPTFAEEWSSNLPVIIIDTLGKTINAVSKIPARMIVINNNHIIGNNNSSTQIVRNVLSPLERREYDGWVGVKHRGRTSLQYFPKKPYRLELWASDSLNSTSVSFPLLGLPPENDWVVHTPYTDKSLMRNYLAYKLGNDIGQYAPRTMFFELFVVTNAAGGFTWESLISNYQGVCLLVERIKIDKRRVDLKKLTATVINYPTISGGYIVKVDKRDPTDVVLNVRTANMLLHDPKPSNINQQQLAYINSFISSMETVLNSTTFNDIALGYPSVLDASSFVDFIIMNELSNNPDAYRISTYFHKDRDQRFRAGPIWDFNISFGNCNYSICRNNSRWEFKEAGSSSHPVAFYFEKLMSDTYFACLLAMRWQKLRTGVLSNTRIASIIDDTAAYLDESQKRNFQKWPILGVAVWSNRVVAGTYQGEVDEFKSYTLNRANWMDSNVNLLHSGRQCAPIVHPSLLITEIMYAPVDPNYSAEFLELKNIGDTSFDLFSFRFTEGLHFNFTDHVVIPPNGLILLVSNWTLFRREYGDHIAVSGEFGTQSKLDNKGDKITLKDAYGYLVFSVEYDTKSPWPTGQIGHSFVFVDSNATSTSATNQSDPSRWRWSHLVGGSPGEEDILIQNTVTAGTTRSTGTTETTATGASISSSDNSESTASKGFSFFNSFFFFLQNAIAISTSFWA